ncbi:fungal hydrophobin [Macrolepiota fuliginosa MF-IS2]|uniref:Hydrophobin n=1 Tax=Macrolepiota fuliginosa MF-IS2 TaxID=1400762 RepID=A0A9P6C3M1_9AGAR|nr:fungal hydrophobin [Macrolepiota fuliginosa MF-IS2]
MFSRVFAAVLVALPIIVSAVPAPTEPHSHGQCNVGEISCCRHTQEIPGAPSAGVSGGLLGGLGLNIPFLLGIDCTPISVLGIGGNNCAAQPVCCENNSFNGLINLFNCAPINLNL